MGHEVFARGDPRIFLDCSFEIKLHNIKVIRLLKFVDQKEFCISNQWYFDQSVKILLIDYVK